MALVYDVGRSPLGRRAHARNASTGGLEFAAAVYDAMAALCVHMTGCPSAGLTAKARPKACTAPLPGFT
ncbi:hypothetical protein GCM10020219_002180 [Nonomuraea dietziae]